MSRPLRIEEPGLWHHVMNRGLEQRAIFIEEVDYKDFLELVGEVGPRWNVWCHAACLLGNHYHLLIHDEGGALGRAMRHVNGVHTQRFNRRHGRDGPLMRGRYRSRLVQEEGYLLEVIRYIHANPIEAGLVRRAGDYPWSSHGCYLQRETPDWLRREAVYERFGADEEGLAAFDTFVHERIPDEIRAELAPKRWRPVLGDESFVGMWRETIRASGVVWDREVVDARRLGAVEIDIVIRTACEHFELEQEPLLNGKRGLTNLARHLAMLASREYTASSNTQIGEWFGVAPATVSSAVRRARGWIDADRQIRERYEELVRVISSKSQDAT